MSVPYVFQRIFNHVCHVEAGFSRHACFCFVLFLFQRANGTEKKTPLKILAPSQDSLSVFETVNLYVGPVENVTLS